MRLVLVRHGQTDYNRDGIALGRADVDLNDTGRAQAERLAAALAREPLEAVYSSPLLRARGTAEVIASVQGKPVTIEERLIEMDVGALDGMPMSEVRRQHGDFLERWLSAQGHAEAMPGGESLADVQARSWPFVGELEERHGGTTVCAVSHNFVILSILAGALGLDLASFRRIKHGIAAVSIIDITGDAVRVLKLNDDCHLS